MNEHVSNVKKPLVAIGIPTYRRPIGLRQLLDSLSRLDCAIDGILIAENDVVSRQGVAVVEQLRMEGFPFSVSVIPVSQRGISHARNALMKQAFKENGVTYLAMVDDDEVVDPHWLSELLRKQKEHDADVVGGKVLSRFPDGKPSWIEGLSIYRLSNKKKLKHPLVDSTANVLLHASLHLKLDQSFDPAYSLTGGGDKEFFVRVQRLGARLAYAPEAITYETYGKSRLTLRWALQRSFRIGAADIRIHMQHSRGFKLWFSELAKIPLAVSVSIVSLPFLALVSRSKAVAALLLMTRQVGKISSLVGIRYQAYKVIHGQ